MTKAAARKEAQRKVVASACERCGATTGLQRHHHDLAKPLEVIVLCQDHHAAEHIQAGTWGRGQRRRFVCVICGQEFDRPDSHPHKTCGPACLSELGRRLAEKRWRAGGIESQT